MRRIMALAVGVRGWIALSAVLRLAVTASLVAQGVLVATVLARLLGGADLGAQTGLLTGLVALVLARFAMTWAGEVVGGQVAAATKQALRTRAFAKLAELGPAYTAGQRTGEMKTALVESIESLEAYYARFVPSLIGVATTPVIVLAVLAGYDVWSALIVAAFIVAALLLPQLWRRLLAQRGDAMMVAYTGLGAAVLDTLQGIVTLKAFGAAGRRRAELATESQRLIAGWDRVMAVALVHQVIYGLAVTGGVATTVAIAAARTAAGALSPAALFIVLLLGAEALRAVGVLASSFHASYTAGSAADLLHRLFDQRPPAPARPDAVPVAGLGTDVAFEDVTFGYGPDGPDVLRGLSLRVEQGTTVAVVGPSGAGKTTLAALLLRFVDPRSGRVTIGGRDVRDLPPDQLRATVALVAQDTYLFGGSVRDNIAMARPAATEDEIAAAARAANAHEFIAALPDGYDTQVGERGLRLSGGQRQRLAIARALLADAPVLVLDEATASVDAASEAAIQSALDGLTAGRTTLVIAHRLSTVRHADRIVVLDGGEVAEAGRHDDLLARSGRYARLVAAQAVSR